MAPQTPDEWLPILAKRLDERAVLTAKLRSYCNGNAPLPEMGANLKTSWVKFQKKARLNYGGLACRALKNRIRPLGVRVGDGTNETASEAAERIYRDTRFGTQVSLAVKDRLEVRRGYLVAGRSADGRAVVTRERPELFYAEVDPLVPWQALAGLKVWRDTTQGKDFALVWAAGQRQRFMRDSKDSSGNTYQRATGEWAPDGNPEEFAGSIPIVVLERPEGTALVEEHLDAIDAINLGKLHRLVITAMQAFRQRALKAQKTNDGTGGLPEKDADGNSIDYSKMFDPAPGALWDLPEGIDIWESEATDIRPLLEGEKKDARDFAALTSTPVSVYLPDGANQSAEGAMSAKEGHISLARDEIDDIRPGVAQAMVLALRIENVDFGDATVEIDFAPPALISLSEQEDAATKARSNGIALRTIMRNIYGWSPTQIREAEADILAERLAGVLSEPEGDANAA